MKHDEHRMGTDVHIRCDVCRITVYLGREDRFEKLAIAYFVVAGRISEREATNLVTARRASYIDSFAMVEAYSRGWRRDLDCDECPECHTRAKKPSGVDNSKEVAV